MNRLINIATVFIQIGLTLMVTFTLYLLFALLDYQGGIDNFIGFSIFQPLLAILFSMLTITICGLVGLPLRLNKRMNDWWRQHFYLAIFMVILGLVSCIISLAPWFVEENTYKMDGMELTRTIPNPRLSITGWFFVAFGTLHIFPPRGLQDKVVNYFMSIE